MKVIDDIGQIYDPTKVNEDKNIDTLIKELELKIENQGMIVNARDEELLSNLKSIKNNDKKKKYLKKYYEQHGHYWCICGRTIQECEGLIGEQYE